jgi:hypothetical protein
MGKSSESTNDEKWAAVALYNYFVSPESHKVAYGALEHICKALNVAKRTLLRYVSEYRAQIEAGNYYPDLSPKKIGKVGAPYKLTKGIKGKIRRVNKAATKRKIKLSIRELALKVNIPKSSMHRYLSDMDSEVVSCWIKPYLTEDHRMRRLQFTGCDVYSARWSTSVRLWC